MGINIQAIKASFELVKPMASIVADRFYEVLFQDFPESKVIFSRVDLPKQKIALISALVQAVGNLDKPDSLTKFLLNLGENHGRYGVEDIHYEWVGQSLIKALQQTLADAWNPDLEYNWTQVYGIIDEAMKAGAKRTKSNVRPLYPDSPAEKQMEKQVDATSKEHLAFESSLTLSLAAKNQIRHLVDRAFEDLIKKEVRICIEENMQNIEKISISDLLKKAV
jgi:hemoglobin-like flavoprotein